MSILSELAKQEHKSLSGLVKELISEILLCTLSAAICGAEGWQDVEDFGKDKIDYLRQYLPYKNGIPRDDTFRRFYRALDHEHFQELFRDWTKSLGSTSN